MASIGFVVVEVTVGSKEYLAVHIDYTHDRTWPDLKMKRVTDHLNKHAAEGWRFKDIHWGEYVAHVVMERP